MTKVYLILLSCLILVTLPLFAQEPAQPIRLELDLDSNNATVEVIALPDSSLLLFTRPSNTWNSKTSVEFTKYDQQLKKVWSKTQEMDERNEYINYTIESPYVYLAFDGYGTKQFHILKLHITTGEASFTEYEIPVIDAIYEFRALKEQYFIIGNDRREYRPYFFHLRPESGKISPLPSVYGTESYFSDLLADSAHNRTDAVLLESNGRVSHLQTKSFDSGGKLIGTYFTPPMRDKMLQHAEVSPGDSTVKLLVGAYGTKSAYYSTGFFTMPLLNNEDGGNFYSFLDLENSLSHLSQRQERRVRRKEQTRLEKRKLPLLRHRLLLHDLISTPEGYVLAAEVYTSQYENNNRNRIMLPDLPLVRKEELYKHSHVLVVAFNKQGELLWDNNFKLNNAVTDDLTPTVEIASAPDGRVIIAYPDEKEVVYRIMDRGAYTDEKTKIKIKGSHEGDKIIGVNEHGIIKWYGPNFAAFGFQRVRSATGDGRSVFYINKITF